MAPLATEAQSKPKLIASTSAMEKLKCLQAEHPIWDCRLLQACRSGLLTKRDFQIIFSQYYRFTQDFTRYLSALMTNCESDYYRSKLSRNLWEEGGGADAESRHAEMFRRFLRDTLGIDPASIQYQSFADSFCCQYLDFCRHAPPLSGAAFLSIGTEGAIARLYCDFCTGLLTAGIPEEDLTFFRVHMECDDEHAETLSELMNSYSHESGWFERCSAAIERALCIRRQFLDDAFDYMLQERMAGTLAKVRNERSLIVDSANAGDLVYSPVGNNAKLSSLYSNSVEGLNVRFTVRRIEFGAEVLDCREVTIAPNSTTELHKHPHESLLTITSGKGQVRVGEFVIKVAAGDSVFVPRWTMHQTENTENAPMQVLAVTDYGLTRHAFWGDQLRTTRMNPDSDCDRE